jgi:hypothetical protein
MSTPDDKCPTQVFAASACTKLFHACKFFLFLVCKETGRLGIRNSKRMNKTKHHFATLALGRAFMDKLLMLPSIYLLYHLSIILDSGQQL